MDIQENVALAPRTTLGVGGPARWFAEIRSEEELREAVDWAHGRALPMFVLGGGSNLVIADEGFSGATLHIATSGIERRQESGREIYDAAAGEDWDGLVAQTVGETCAGLECL